MPTSNNKLTTRKTLVQENFLIGSNALPNSLEALWLEMGSDGRLHSNISDQHLQDISLNGEIPLNREYLHILDDMLNKYYYRQDILQQNIDDTKNMEEFIGYKSTKNGYLPNPKKFIPKWKDLSASEYFDAIADRVYNTPLYDGIVTQVEGSSLDKSKNYRSSLKSGTLGKSYDWRFNYNPGPNLPGLQGISILSKKPWAAVFAQAYTGKLPYLNENDARHEMTHLVDNTNLLPASPMSMKVQLIKEEMMKANEWYSNPNDKSPLNINYNGSSDESHVRPEELWNHLLNQLLLKYQTDENFRKLFDGYTLKEKQQFWNNFYHQKFSPEDFEKGGKYYDFYKERFKTITPKAASRILNEVAYNETPNLNNINYAKSGIKLIKKSKFIKNPRNKSKLIKKNKYGTSLRND